MNGVANTDMQNCARSYWSFENSRNHEAPLQHERSAVLSNFIWMSLIHETVFSDQRGVGHPQ